MNARRILGSLLATALAATVAGRRRDRRAGERRDDGRDPNRAHSPGARAPQQLSTPVEYGDTISVITSTSRALVDGVWTDIYHGHVTVTEQLIGRARPRPRSPSSDSAYLYTVVTARRQRRPTPLDYSGGDQRGLPHVYAPASASSRSSNVQRKLDHHPDERPQALGLAGQDRAPQGQVKVIVLKKVGKKWKRYKACRSTNRGTLLSSGCRRRASAARRSTGSSRSRASGAVRPDVRARSTTRRSTDPGPI